MALETVNSCLSEAIGALARGRADGDSRTAGLIYSGNDILEAYKFAGVARSVFLISCTPPILKLYRCRESYNASLIMVL